jgi:hypothetical protein
MVNPVIRKNPIPLNKALPGRDKRSPKARARSRLNGYFYRCHIHSPPTARLQGEMKTVNGFKPKEPHVLDATVAAMERMELYCVAHPGSPSAARRPQLLYRGQLWVALVGPSVEDGIVGIGQTVEAALRAFDAQYLAASRPPAESLGTVATNRN